MRLGSLPFKALPHDPEHDLEIDGAGSSCLNRVVLSRWNMGVASRRKVATVAETFLNSIFSRRGSK